MGFKRSRVQIPPARFAKSVTSSCTFEDPKDMDTSSNCSVDSSVRDFVGD
jgi:hypothetical protein